MAITVTAMLPPTVQRCTIAPHRCHPTIIAYMSRPSILPHHIVMVLKHHRYLHTIIVVA